MTIPDSINIQPSSRILRVLGDIEFEAWQCLAELADNSFDDFTEILRSGVQWQDGFKVSILLPENAGPTAEIVIEDNGRGMDLTTLNKAVKAGWSSNDRFGKLGLFGMGFNIATARIGRVARVFTTRAGDPEWIGVEIDLDRIGDDFQAPVLRKRKESLSEHGTKVEISRLEPTRAGWLGKNATKTRAMLGDVYSHLLVKKPFQLFVNGVVVRARRPCVWDEIRSVTFGQGSTAEQIPAVIKINEKLPDAEACLDCGNWQELKQGVCDECEGRNLVLKERRIHGWLGIQRYLHKTEFGIDFLRNGRKILRYDKRLFQWSDPNEPLAAPETEYPVELGQGGRIVGEIHLDHVPVNYQKNAFEWSDRQWIAAVRFLRGKGPLLPKRAKDLGYPPNESPLARLHKAYRRNDPGYRFLIPGNGQGPIHATTVEWRDKFHKGETEYQTDQKWWEAVEYHEQRLAQVSGNSSGVTSGDVLEEIGLGGSASAPPPTGSTAQPITANQGSGGGASAGKASGTPLKPETDKDRIARYREGAVKIPELSKEYNLTEIGIGIDVIAYLVAKHEVRDGKGCRAPVWLVRDQGVKYFAFIDANHSVLKDFGDTSADLLVCEVAHYLRTRADNDMPLSQVVALLKERRLSDLKIDPTLLSGQARELLDTLRKKMVLVIAHNPERAWQFLTQDERATTETNLVVASIGLGLEQVVANGEFLRFTPLMFLARLVEEWPEAFMDGKVFVGAYTSVSTPPGRRISVGRVVSYLYDAALLAESRVTQPAQLARCRLGLQLLRSELAQSSNVE